MSNMQRAKGRAGEQEVARLLRDWLGLDIKRNWLAQSAEGGADLTGIPGWCAEVKFAELFRAAWWRQTIEQAEKADRKPALIFRISNKHRGQHPLEKWRVFVRLRDISNDDISSEHTAEISLRTWIEVVRESMDPMEATYRLNTAPEDHETSKRTGSISQRPQSASESRSDNREVI